MDQVLYDEFGNYIGPEITDESVVDEDAQTWMDEEEETVTGGEPAPMETEKQVPSEEAEGPAAKQAVVLYEDKKFYPTAEEVYGDVETLVQEEDTQPLTEPIVAPIKELHFFIEEKSIPNTVYVKVCSIRHSSFF
jgi:U5 small nuclear ribonucleoprotein component